jgi:cell division protein FtsI (penicillin-binding protein 3)
MGARDAVYQMERRGLKVKVQGRGKVKHQSFPAGKTITDGAECILTLEN